MHKTSFFLYVVFVLICLCSGCKTAVSDTDSEGYVSIFDGKTLNGWKGDSIYWRVENGVLTGEVLPTTLLSRNSFIIWQGAQPGDFELKLEFRVSEDGNSGINYRSELIDTLPYALKGYQCDIDGKNHYTGMNYEERKRTTLARRGQIVITQTPADSVLATGIKDNVWLGSVQTGTLGNPDSMALSIKHNDWNEVHLIVKGNRLQHYINNILTSDVTDNDSTYRRSNGHIGVQVHVGPPMKIEYRNIRIKILN